MRFDDIFPTKRIQLLGKEYDTISKPEAYFRASKYPNVMVEKDTGYRWSLTNVSKRILKHERLAEKNLARWDLYDETNIFNSLRNDSRQPMINWS